MKNPRPFHPPNPPHNRPSLENRKSRALNDAGNINKKKKKKKKKKRKSSKENTNRDQVSQVLLTSAEKIAGNEDLLSEILLRLPVRSLVRFKCVSKPWLLLISSSHFSHAHSSRNFHSLPVPGFIFPVSKITGFDFVGVDGARPKFPPSLAFMKKLDVTVLHSCNGLILCSTDSELQDLDDYYICNPTTKKFSSIPPPPLEEDHDYLCEFGINLVFDPSRSPHFKVVYFTGMTEPDRSTYRTHLYSSITQSWSSLESPDRAFFHSSHDDPHCPLDDGVLCNGSLYWLCTDQWKLLRFQVDEQRFSTITMNVDTNLIGERDKLQESAHLWQCKGKLYLVKELNKINVLEHLVIYEMGNVCSEWLVKYMVKFPDEVSGLDDSDEDGEFCTYTILAAVGGQKNDDDDDMLLLIRLEYSFRDDSNVILYSIKEKTTTKMIFDDYELEAQPYVESLSPVI